MSITLPAALATTFTVGGVTTETNGFAACVPIALDFVNNTALFSINQGVTSGPNFTPGAHGNIIQVTINTVTGAWSANSGLSGILSGAGLTNLNTTLRGLRNSAESFAISAGIVPGATQVPW